MTTGTTTGSKEPGDEHDKRHHTHIAKRRFVRRCGRRLSTIGELELPTKARLKQEVDAGVTPNNRLAERLG